jgi:hypothetical protein
VYLYIWSTNVYRVFFCVIVYLECRRVCVCIFGARMCLCTTYSTQQKFFRTSKQDEKPATLKDMVNGYTLQHSNDQGTISRRQPSLSDSRLEHTNTNKSHKSHVNKPKQKKPINIIDILSEMNNRSSLNNHYGPETRDTTLNERQPALLQDFVLGKKDKLFTCRPPPGLEYHQRECSIHTRRYPCEKKSRGHDNDTRSLNTTISPALINREEMHSDVIIPGRGLSMTLTEPPIVSNRDGIAQCLVTDTPGVGNIIIGRDYHANVDLHHPSVSDTVFKNQASPPGIKLSPSLIYLSPLLKNTQDTQDHQNQRDQQDHQNQRDQQDHQNQRDQQDHQNQRDQQDIYDKLDNTSQVLHSMPLLRRKNFMPQFFKYCFASLPVTLACPNPLLMVVLARSRRIL